MAALCHGLAASLAARERARYDIANAGVIRLTTLSPVLRHGRQHSRAWLARTTECEEWRPCGYKA
jgi:hypothetical protein